ncbi:MAG: ribonuclease P protein component [Clostridiales bacterium]|nr:ribonuclease P protein component [Candidatus Cacconaster stercorequi]
MKASCTVKENYEFRRIYRKGRSAVSPCLVVYCQKNRKGNSRLGVTVSTKLGHAVVRNRVRRQLREIYRLNKDRMLPGYDVILVARVRAVHTPYRRIEHSYLQALGQLKLLREEEK